MLAYAFLAIGGAAVHAQDIGESRSPPVLSLNLKAGVIDDVTIRSIAELSLKKPVQIEKTQTLAAFATERCGSVDPAFFRILAIANPDFAGAEPSATTIPSNTVVNMTPCIPALSLGVTEKVVEPKDSFWKYWNGDPKIKSHFDWSASINPGVVAQLRLPTADPQDFTFNEATQKFTFRDRSISFPDLMVSLNNDAIVKDGKPTLKYGDAAVLPTINQRWISFETDPSKPVNVASLGTQFPASTDVTAGDHFQPLFEIAANCTPFGADADRDKDVVDLLAAVATEGRKRGLSPWPMPINILDSGVVTSPNGIVRPGSITKRLAALQFSGASVDFAPLSAPDIDQYRDHGTKASSLVLGGEAYSSAAVKDFQLSLVPARVFELDTDLITYENGTPVKDPNGPGVARRREGRFQDQRVLAALADAQIFILNLSLGRHDPITGQKNFGAEVRPLYVVAAGNYGEDLREAKNVLFPANYGGDSQGRDNVITVGSVDGDLKRSKFSNYGVGVVDIAAPGCKVPVQGFDFQANAPDDVVASGTSFSAPQVTFVAAIFRSIYPDAPAQEVKLRIIQSADLMQSLSADFTDGRVLNVQKALSIFWDTVETKNSHVRLHRGTLTPAPSTDQFCTDLHLPEGSRLLKVRFGFDGKSDHAGSNYVYWLDVGNVLQRKECTSKDGTITVTTDAGVETISTQDAVDLTPATQPL